MVESSILFALGTVLGISIGIGGVIASRYTSKLTNIILVQLFIGMAMIVLWDIIVKFYAGI